MIAIVVCLEGGGDIVAQRRTLRQGFDRLFSKWRDRAPRNGCSLRFVCCGSRTAAYEDFRAAAHAYSERVNALLVNAKAPVSGTTAQHRAGHLAQRDGWNFTGNPRFTQQH